MLLDRKDTLQKIGIDVYHQRKKDAAKKLNSNQVDVWKELEKGIRY